MMIERILRGAVIVGLFLVPFLPFVVTNSLYFPFITGKNFSFRILVEILFALWLILAFINKDYRPTFSWLLVALGSFLSIITIADIFGENPLKSFWSNFERMEGLITLLHLGAYFLILGTIAQSKKLWFALANTSVVASIIMAIYGFFQLSGKLVINQGGVRVDGTLGNAAYLGIYMLFHIFITLILLAKWRGGNLVRAFYIGAIILQVIILFQTATRGTILGLAGGLFLSGLLIVVFGREYPRLRKGAVALLAFLVLAGSGIFLARDADVIKNNTVFSRIANISLEEGSSRFLIWGLAIEGFKEKPLLGWGQENFTFVFDKYYNPSLYHQEPWFDRSHNIFFDWLIAGGVLGLLAYLSLFLAGLFCLWMKKGREHFSLLERSLITGLFAGYFFHNLFVFDNIISYILFFSVLAYVYAETRYLKNERAQTELSVERYAVAAFSVVIILLVSATIYFANIPGIRTSATLIDALSDPTPSRQVHLLEEALSFGYLGLREVSEQSVQIAISRVRDQNTPLEARQQLFSFAQRAMEEQIKRVPDSARNHVFLASLYDQFGQFENARQEFEKALALSPLKQRIRNQLAFTYLNQERYDEALNVFRETYEASPDIDEIGVFYGAGAIYAGKDELARHILDPIEDRYRKNGIIADQSFLLRAYAEDGQYERALDIWEYRLGNNPEDDNIRLSFTATLIRLGRDEEAIAEIEKIMRKNSEFRAQGQFFINEIHAGRGNDLIQ